MILKTTLGMALVLAASLGVADAGNTIQLYAEPVDGNVTLWKGYRRLFHSIHGSPNNLVFGFSIPNAATRFELKDPSFQVTVPPGVKAEEFLAVHRNPNTGYAERFDLKVESEKSADGTVVFRFPNLKDFFEIYRDRGTRPAVKEIDVFFEPEKWDPAKEYTVFYDFSNGGVKLNRRHVILKFLPPIKESGKLPSRFVFRNMTNFLWQFKVRDKALLQRIMKKYEAAGMNSSGCLNPDWEKDYETVLRDAGWKFTQMLVWDPLIYKIPEPVKPAVLADGTTSKTHHCITAALKNKQLLDAVAYRNFNYERILDGDELVIDHEPFGYMKSACFCKDCLDRFASDFNLDRVALTSPAVIEKKFASQWLEFCSAEQSKLMESRIREFKRRYPHSRITAYNYFLPFDDPEKLAWHLTGCPLDPRRMDSYIDIHLPSTYYHHGKVLINALRNQKKHLRKPVGGTISTDRAFSLFSRYLSGSDMLSPSGTRLELLTIASLGGPEVQNYSQHYSQDGWTFVKIAGALREIAVCEDYYLDGAETDEVSASVNREWSRKYEAEDLNDGFAVIAKKIGNGVLATVFNYGREFPVKADFRYSGGLKTFYVSDPVKKIRYLCNGKESWDAASFASLFHCTVAPEDAAFVRITPEPTDSDSFRTENVSGIATTASETAKDLKPDIAAEKKYIGEQFARDFKSRRHQTSEILHSDGRITVNTPVQQVIFSEKSGLILSWKTRTDGREIFPEFDLSRYSFSKGGAWAAVHAPNRYAEGFLGSHLPYRVFDENIVDDASVVVKLGYLHEDFFFRKDFEISPTETKIKVTTSLKNLTEYPLKMSFRFRNCFTSPQIVCSLDGKPVSLKAYNNFFYPASNADGRAKHEPKKEEHVGGLFNGNAATVGLPAGNLAFSWQGKDLASLLIYKDEKVSTLELITLDKLIRPMREYSFSYEMTAK
ncbi:MAG: hypothetical protein BWY31_01654 [Lentisphaerae bacterium ADurb.Bin242]|nr:MAG: hypothetical protein BWY31_01654 [Lentisphaerae bacterium ADurb.Bin242]